MFKKSLIMLLCLSLVAFTMLTGCGKDEKDSEKNETTETTEGVSKPNYEIEYYDGYYCRELTKKSQEIGLTLIKKQNQYGNEYNVILYDRNAQEYIINHLSARDYRGKENSVTAYQWFKFQLNQRIPLETDNKK